TALVAGGVPVNNSKPKIVGPAQQGQTLTETHGEWTNSPTSYAYQWLQCDSEGNNGKTRSAASRQTYTPVAGDVGHKLKVEETATNAGGSAEATSAATEVIKPLPPSNTTPPTITGEARRGKTLTEVHGTWTNNPTSYAYQWLQCNGEGTLA